MKSIVSNRSGNFALTFALLIVPIFGAAGVAVDYSRAVEAKSRLQNLADQTALAVVALGSDGDASPFLAYARKQATATYGTSATIDPAKVTGKWQGTIDYQVTVSGQMAMTILAAVPGFPKSIPIAVSSIAEVGEPQYKYGPPTLTELDPSAADYNRLSVYCFDPDEASDPKTHGRTKMTVIADNAGTKYDYKMPECDEGQAMSFKLYNVRNARTESDLWDDPSAEHYTYYTDTVISSGREDYTGLTKPMLETVLCDKKKQCNLTSKQSIIPEGPDRTPERATQACSPGKYMYYGWEDRPPGGAGGSDQDYNDIRIVIGCPTVIEVGDKSVRLLN